jgi:DNA-binding IclR family transcriptional regulator
VILEEHGLPQLTPKTITTREKLYNELEEIRTSDVGFSDEELVEGFRTVAAPVRQEGSEILGSLCVSGPINWLNDELFREELPELVRGTANELELTISHSRD